MTSTPSTSYAPSEPTIGSPPVPSPLREAAAFVASTYVVAIVVALCLPGTVADPGPAPLVSLFVPSFVVAVLLLARRRHREAARAMPFGLRRAGLRGWLPGVLLPVIAIGLPFVIADRLGIVTIVDVGGYLTNAPVELAMLTVLVLGEEIGWRGYLLPRLALRLPARRASLMTGLAQGLFHLPLILLTVSYDAAGNRAVVAVGAVSVITLGGILFGWLRIRTGSLWPVAIAHATVNVCIIESPYLTSRHADLAAACTGEAGILTLACTAIIVTWLYRRADWTPIG